jgi:hypothetical protein
MNPIAKILRHPAVLRAKLPVLMLITLLQRSPVARLWSAAGEFFGEAPTGFVLKSSVATMAALGAVHTLAGATSYALQATASTPISAAADQAISPIGFTVTNTINIGSWKITGAIPAGLKFTAVEGGNSVSGTGGVLDATTPGTSMDDGYGGTTTSGGNLRTTPVLSGTPTAAGAFTIHLTAFEFGAASGLVSPTYDVVVNVAGSTPAVVPPTVTTNPTSVSVGSGSAATFSVAASDSAATIQWTKNGNNIAGATSATLTLSNVQTADSGSTYAAVITNAGGSVTSAAATLTVTAAASKPAFTIQPASVTVLPGATAALNATATGATSYQWQFNGANVAGATNARLVLSNVGPANSGTYAVIATNAAGSATSSSATVSSLATPSPGRLINLSVLTTAGAGSNLLTVGFTTGGSGTSGQQALLVRGVGPALAAFGLPTPFQPDPTLAVINQATHASVVTNDNWGSSPANTAAVISADNSTGAFPLASTASLDSATALPLAAGGYSVQIAANGSVVGNVLAEVYDNTPSGTYSVSTPRLTNLSCLSGVSGGGNLVAGFTVGGSTSRTVLIRATGPALGSLGVPGTLVDPQIVLTSGASVIATNAGWGGDAAIVAASTAVNAFALTNAASKDSVILVTLPPGGYSATASSVSSASGTCLIEVYEVP